MRQDAQKQARKFCGRKAAKKRKTHPVQPEKGETGCVLGAGGDGNGCEQVRTDRKDRKARRNSWDGLVSAAASVGPGRSPPGCRPPRHAPQAGLRAHLTWSPLRSGRLVACVPLARTRPSARGFGVDVGTSHRERGKTGVTRFLPQVTKRAVLVWCCVEKPSCRER